MRKKFLINASIATIGSSIIAVIVSALYFFTYMNIDEGNSLLNFLNYLNQILSSIAMSIGYGTVIYACAKFNYRTIVESLGLCFLSFIPFFIYQSVTWLPFLEEQSGTAVTGSYESNAILMGIYQSMGSGIINQIFPALIIAFIACKIMKGDGKSPQAIIGFSNKAQKSMLISCFVMFGLNMVAFFATSPYMLPYLIDSQFLITVSVFKSMMQLLGLELLFALLYNVIIAYIVYMVLFKFYDSKLNSDNNTQEKIENN